MMTTMTMTIIVTSSWLYLQLSMISGQCCISMGYNLRSISHCALMVILQHQWNYSKITLKRNETFTYIYWRNQRALFRVDFSTKITTYPIHSPYPYKVASFLAHPYSVISTLPLAGFLPCTKINLSIRTHHYSHVFSRNSVVFGWLHIPEIGVRSPYDLSRISCHRERFTKVVSKSWIIPPLTKKYIHWIALWNSNTYRYYQAIWSTGSGHGARSAMTRYHMKKTVLMVDIWMV